jgi:hypothetical protein
LKLVECKVTACDRDGRVWRSEVVSGDSTLEVETLRADVFKLFQKRWPDCQIYFNWKFLKEREGKR